MINYCSHPAAARLVSLALILFVNCFVSFAQDIPTEAANIQAGQALFNNNCKACHNIYGLKTGPELAGVHDRAPSIDWIVSFIKNPSAKISSGDEYAVGLYEKFKPTIMTSFPLKDDDIMNILAYVKSETDKGPPSAAVTPGDSTNVANTGGAGIPSGYLNAILIGMLIILLLLLVVLGLLVSAIKRFLDQRDLTEEEREVVHSPYSTSSILRSRGFVFIVVFVVAALGFKAVINGLYSVGIQQGYAPKQPIAFSHKIHAGQYQIDCQYCHTGVMNAKNANIPSANICMNCHNQIKQGTITGETEIALLVNAYNNNQPIEWIRIHNLPDLSYFNHSQHVNVGGIACQTCHGPVEEMDVVRQHSLLTMGWCIDCHRTTPVNVKGNEYYKNLVELEEKAHDMPLTVEEIGGLECAKCHY